MDIHLYMKLHNGSFCLKISSGNGGPEWHQVKLPVDEEGHTKTANTSMRDFLANWLFWKVHSIFRQMPITAVKAHCDQNVLDDYEQQVRFVMGCMQNTNAYILKYSEHKGACEDLSGILFYNVTSDLRYKSLYDRMNASKPTNYLNLELGFDRETRKWSSVDLPMSVDDFIQYLLDNKIGKMVTVNTYVTDKYLHHTGVNLFSIFRLLGVQLTIIDNDPFDLKPHGFLHKAAFNNPDWIRFSTLPTLNKEWDKQLQLTNVRYTTIPQDYSEPLEPMALPEDFRIVILSNSRIEGIKGMLAPIRYVLDNINHDFRELPLWYMSLRYLVLHVFELTDFERLYYNSGLHNFYFHVANMFKHSIIEGLATHREVRVYGDVGWKETCEPYYCGSLDNGQIEELYKDPRNLYLLLNCLTSYVDSSGPIHDVVRRGVPWFNVAPLVKLSSGNHGFEALTALEYRDIGELNTKLERAPGIYKSEKLLDGLKGYRKFLNSSVSNIEDSVLWGLDRSAPHDFERAFHLHDAYLHEMIIDYIDKNENLLLDTFGIFKL
jgi:hypothetical protein